MQFGRHTYKKFQQKMCKQVGLFTRSSDCSSYQRMIYAKQVCTLTSFMFEHLTALLKCYQNKPHQL